MFLLFTITSLTSYAQNVAEKNLIEGTVIKFFDAIADLDDSTMKAELTSDFTLIEHGLVWNADSLINHLKPLRGKQVTRINKLDFTKTEQQGDVAWVYYFNTAELKLGEKKKTVKWLESAVLVKQSGKWRIKLLHSTDLK